MARIRIYSILTMFFAAIAVTSCNLTITPPGGDGTGSISFDILGARFTFSFGPVGVIDVRANETVAQAGALRLFDEPPASTPPSGTMRLLGTDVGVGRLLTSKTIVRSQSTFGNGTAHVRFSIAAGESAALCDTATFLAEYDLVIAAGSVNVLDDVYELSQQALAVIVQNDVTVCIEVTADFDGQLSFTNFSFEFGGGNPGTAALTLRNTDNENIHILLPGETFGDANRISPGGTRNATLDNQTGGSPISLSAGRNGVVLDTTTCPAVTGVNYEAQVVWNGSSVTCNADQDLAAGDPTVTPGTSIQVPINAFGDAISPSDTFGGIDYGIIGVLNVNSSPTFPPTEASSVTPAFGEVPIDLAELGLTSVDTIYLATASAWIPDVPNGITISTLECSYAEGGTPTTLDLVSGSTTAEWSWERVEHTTQYGGVPHDLIPVLYSSPTSIDSVAVYDGYMFGVTLPMDSSRTLTGCTLSLNDPSSYIGSRVPGSPPNGVPDWAGTAIVGMTLVGPATGTGGGGGGPSTSGTGTVTGQVVNAQTGDPLSGVTITVQGTSISTTSSATGSFTLMGVPAGTPVLVAVLDGFVETTQPVILVPNATTETSIGMLALGAGGDNIAAVLAWGETPFDLDLHMSGPDGAGGVFHAYFSNKTPVEHVFLDLDDTISFGPETMTVSPASGGSYVTGEYSVWVHNFSSTPEFDVSGATVTLFVGGVQRAQYRVSNASGDGSKDIWLVVRFTVNADGSVTSINQQQTFDDGSSSSVF